LRARGLVCTWAVDEWLTLQPEPEVELVGLAYTGEGCLTFCDCDHEEGAVALFIMFVPPPIVPGSDTPRKNLFGLWGDSVDVEIELKLEEEDELEGVEDGKNAE
jgi:hypothetical protein